MSSGGLIKKLSKIEIRPIATSEHELCAVIYAQAWNSALPDVHRTISTSGFEDETKGERIWVAVLDKQVVGYVSIWQRDWFIHHLYVAPSFHGVGIGKALIGHTLDLAGPNMVSLKCQIANSGAIQFYRSLGFVEDSEVGSDAYGEWVRLSKQPV